jgi:hypothetical protein
LAYFLLEFARWISDWNLNETGGGIMKRKVIVGVLSLSLMLFVVSAGFASLESLHHEYIMRGQILEVNGDTAYLCIGSADGAQVGQELTVYRFIKTGSPGPETQVYYKREETGKVKITEIVHEHMANAKIISGQAKEHDVVELK